MPDITNYDGRLEQMALYCEAILDNIAKVNNAYQDVSNDAYSVSLPSDMIKFKGLKKVGGKTIVYNQLVNSGTTTVSTISGHKYYTLISGTASIVNGGSAITIVDDTADMVCDLTLMFGSGNEPSTTSAFAEIFPASHYPYNAGTLLSAGVTKVVSKDADTTTIATYPIPAEIQALEGYGWSAGTAYNYVDFERKVFVQRVGRVDLGSLNWNVNSDRFTTTSALSPSPISGNWSVSNKVIVCSKYTIAIVNAGNGVDKAIGMNAKFLYARDTSYATASDFKTAMDGVMLYYELATPVETDISEYLTADNLISVEAGGTLTFENQNGDDYRIPVPVELEYIGVS